MAEAEISEDLKHFLSVYLGREGAGDETDLRNTLFGWGGGYSNHVREGFAAIIAGRTMTVDQYGWITDLFFPHEETLYGYIEAMWAYLFEGSNDFPVPPDSAFEYH